MNNCSNEASEADHHHHSHDHEHGDSQHHTHPHGDPPIPTNVSQSINNKIDTSKLIGYNLINNSNELPKLFKTIDKRYETVPVFKSEFDSEMIIVIPFTGPVKVFSLLINGSKPPQSIKIYKNSPNLCFDNINNAKPTYQCEHPQNVDLSQGYIEHHLPRRKFAGTTSLTLFLEGGNADRLELFALELRGDYAGPHPQLPVSLLYESAARPQDHKVAEQTTRQNLNSN